MKHLIDSSKGQALTLPIGRQMNLKKQLRLYLDLRGISAAELSRKTKVSKQVLSLWLSGSKPKNIEQVKNVADVLEVTLDHLLFGSGKHHETEKFKELDALLGNEWIGGTFEIKLRRVK